MSEKTKHNNDQEDELNQARFLVERGIHVPGTETPGEDGETIFDSEDILDTKSRGREEPANVVRPISKAADKSKFFGHGFEGADDKGIRRTPDKDTEDKDSLAG